MIHGGFPKKKALVFSFLTTALQHPLGMVISFPLISQIGPGHPGILLSLSAGALGGGILVAVLIILLQ